jgi:hypothetical protein
VVRTDGNRCLLLKFRIRSVPERRKKNDDSIMRPREVEPGTQFKIYSNTKRRLCITATPL